MKKTKTHFAEDLYSFFSHSRFLQAMSIVVFGTATGAFAIRSVMGNSGLISILCLEIILLIFTLIAKRRSISWPKFAPLTILLFVSWCLLSYFWSYYPKATVSGILSQITFTFLAFATAATRDTFQMIRALGDVLRVFLAASLILEIFSGILIDGPIEFLGIKGDLITGDGIQGLFGTRNLLSIISVIALFTFFVEQQSKSVSKVTAVTSISIGLCCLLFSASPVGAAALVGILLATFLIQALRKMEPALRFRAEIFSLISGLIVLIIFWIFRLELISSLKVAGPLSYRLNLWFEEWRITSMKPIEGWGWVGLWPSKTQPFTVMNDGSGERHLTGLNAYLDSWLQVGFIGFSLLLIALLLMLFNSWRTATHTRNIAMLWPVLMSVLLLTTGFVESFMLTEFGWLLFCICAVIAAKNTPRKRANP